MHKTISIGGILAVLIWGAVFVMWYSDKKNTAPSVDVVEQREDVQENHSVGKEHTEEETVSVSDIDKSAAETTSSDDVIVAIPRKVTHSVPFTPQAPSAQWEDPRYQDACEEASLLMAARWARGEEQNIQSQDAEEELEKLFAYEQKLFGDALDTSAEDTAKIMREYFNHDNVRVQTIESVQEIVRAIAAGHIVVAPADGQKVGNKYFSGAGPERHMFVITGYDQRKKEFITNDPGTRRGENYRYDYDVLLHALRDYPTGTKQPIIQITKKIIIVGR